ncbi:MAG: arylsulfatase [Verrucomicrobia bacterium]|nr:arylsulfatase [Verrucomicrobiota bacterium]
MLANPSHLLAQQDGRAAGNAARKPNIIFILADDLGYGDLGCYGQKMIKTPHLDKLASEGMRFTQCYAGSTVCAPSRSALMTGQHTGHTRIRGNARHPLKPEDFTVAEVLKSAGYQTAVMGKWGLGEAGSTGAPTRKGFDEFFGYLNQRHAHNYFPTHLWRNEQKVPLRNEVPNEDSEGSGVAVRRIDYSHDLIAREALDFLDRHRDRPFFLYFAVTIPHANNEAKGQGMEVPSDEPYTRETWPQPERNKAAMITRLDADVGKLMGKLNELKIDEQTIVFFSSDNGPHREGGNDPKFFDSSGPLRGIKRDLYEGGIRVPMIVRWPGKIKAGTVNPHVWAFWDFLPTAAEIAGVQPPKGADGTSALPTLLGRQQSTHAALYWEFHERGFKQAVRMGNWKGIRLAQGQPLELFDLKTDIGETKNLAAQHPEIVASIEAYLQTARTESELWPVKQ